MAKKLMTSLIRDPSTGKWGLYEHTQTKSLFTFDSADEAITFACNWCALFITSAESMRLATAVARNSYSEEYINAAGCYETGLVGEDSFECYRQLMVRSRYKNTDNDRD